MTGQDRGADLLAEFAQFLEAKEQAARRSSGADVDIPLFEKLPDGSERSATLPGHMARRLLESWGWIEPEGAEGGSETDEGGAQGGAARQFFQGLAGGKQASGPAPASGQRAPRKAAG